MSETKPIGGSPPIVRSDAVDTSTPAPDVALTGTPDVFEGMSTTTAAITGSPLETVLHGKERANLINLARNLETIGHRHPEKPPPTEGSLEVLLPKGALPFEAMPLTSTPIEHAERSANLALLTALLEERAPDLAALGGQYDTMIASVVAALLDGAPPVGRQISLVSVPSAAARFLTWGGFGPEALSAVCTRVCEIVGDDVRLIDREGAEKRGTLVRTNGDLTLKTPDGQRPATPTLESFFGYALPNPVRELLAGLEVGAEIYRDAQGDLCAVADGQAGVVVYDDGAIATSFSNQHASEKPAGADLLFGYHSHPDVQLTPQMPVDPTRASFADLLSFARTAQTYDHAVPNIVWFRSGEDQLTGRIYVPKKDKWGYETPSRAVGELIVTVARP